MYCGVKVHHYKAGVGQRWAAAFSTGPRTNRAWTHLGCFDTEEDAARAFDAYASKQPGYPRHKLNFP